MNNNPIQAEGTIEQLLALMAALRNPQTGCPWNIEQNFQTIAPYAIEEAYEVADAVMRQNRADLCEELGDLLLQVVYHARMAEEEGSFDFYDVVHAINAKLIRRHPHMFGTKRERAAKIDSAAVKRQWEAIKEQEKQERQNKKDKQAEPCAKTGAPSLTAAANTKGALRETQTASLEQMQGQTSQALAFAQKLRERLPALEAVLRAGTAQQAAQEYGEALLTFIRLGQNISGASVMAPPPLGELAAHSASFKQQIKPRGEA